MELEQFERLVARVESLLNRCEELNKEKENLTALLKEKEQEIAALKDKASVYEHERSQVGSKVDGLLAQIDRFMAE